MKTSEVLNKAADLIEERGWVKGSPGWSKTGPFCLEGGIYAALGVDADSLSRLHLYTYVTCPILRYHPAYVAVREFIDLPSGRSLWSWNDTRRTKEQVIEVLRAAALIEQAREADLAHQSISEADAQAKENAEVREQVTV